MDTNKKEAIRNQKLGTAFERLAIEISNKNKIERSQLPKPSAYDAVKSEMEQDPIIGQHFNKDVQFGVGGFRGNANNWLDCMLSVFLHRKQTDTRAELAQDVYNEFENFFYSEELDLIAVAPVQGLGMFKENEALRTATSRSYDDEDRPLSLADDLQLAVLTPAESAMTHQMEIVRRHHIRMTSTTYAVKNTFTIRKKILENDPHPQDAIDTQNDFSQILNTATVRIEQAVTALRIFKPGRILIGGLLVRIRDPIFSNHNVINFALPNPYFDPNPYTFDLEKEGSALVRLFNAFVQSTSSKKNLSLAARWFRKAGEADSFEDRVIALMIAAEALSQTGKKRLKGDYIAEFISELFPSEKRETESLVRAFYRLRNAIVHDGTMSKWINRNLPTEAEFYDFIAKNSEIIRQALIKIISSDDSTVPKKTRPLLYS